MNINTKTTFKKSIKLFEEGCAQGFFPGGVLSIGNKDGEIVRYHTGYRSLYPEREPLKENTLFDIASLTKIVATTTIALRFIEEGRLSLQDNLGLFFDSLPEDKQQIKVINLLTHTGGFYGSIPIYELCQDKQQAITTLLKYPLKQPPCTEVIYSCLGYIILGRILESIAGKGLESLVEEYVLAPLEMKSTGFNPKGENIASTEFSKDINGYLKGIVHDENARFLGGISGNAGLFSNIEDMNKYVQMLANRGSFKGESFLGRTVFEKSIYNYTEGMSEHRGLGFSLKDNRVHPTGDLFSLGSYGHTGYTGTSIWVDRESSLYVVSLTNRVHPTRENQAIIRFRRVLHNLIFSEYTK